MDTMEEPAPFTALLSAESMAEVLAGVLERLIESNEASGAQNSMPTIFDAVTPPSISIRMYLRRIVEYVKCSGESAVMTLIYIDRLIERRAFAVTALNAHRLVITSVLVASKCFDDEFYSNGFFAQVGGVSVKELNKLEREFLFLLQFSTHVTPTMYTQYANGLTQAAASMAAQNHDEPSPSSKQKVGSRRIRDCQMEPQNEPPSPKRMNVSRDEIVDSSFCRLLEYSTPEFSTNNSQAPPRSYCSGSVPIPITGAHRSTILNAPRFVHMSRAGHSASRRIQETYIPPPLACVRVSS